MAKGDSARLTQGVSRVTVPPLAGALVEDKPLLLQEFVKMTPRMKNFLFLQDEGK